MEYECYKCDAYINQLEELIHKLECRVIELENENCKLLDESIQNKLTWSIEL